MTLNSQRIDKHLENNNMRKETLAGFTKGCQKEDKLFILQYCIEYCIIYRLPLTITSVDCSKASDSVKEREHQIINAL